MIHPFAKTIERQYQNRKYLWSNQEVLPDFELKTIKAVQTIAGETFEFIVSSCANVMTTTEDTVDFVISVKE